MKRFINFTAFIFLFAGMFLSGLNPSTTGAVIGISVNNTTSFLGIMLFILGIIMFLANKEQT
ncbi:MAG: hypothetical protein ABIC91_00630 [Nanoarchaeota archaeon]